MTAKTRPARPADHPRLRAIQQASIPEPSPQLLAASVDGPLTALVRVDGDVIGYVLAVTADERGYVPEIAVCPDRQNRGHGSALLEAICRTCRERNLTHVRLMGRAPDRRVRTFYEQHGFEQVERVPEYYESGADAVVYERDVTRRW